MSRGCGGDGGCRAAAEEDRVRMRRYGLWAKIPFKITHLKAKKPALHIKIVEKTQKSTSYILLGDLRGVFHETLEHFFDKL